MIKKCAHKWKYCEKCHDWGCAEQTCPQMTRKYASGGLLSFSGYHCIACSKKKCTLCNNNWHTCDVCGDGGCSTADCPKSRWAVSGFFSSGGCKTCKGVSKDDEELKDYHKWEGACACGWTWAKCDENSAGCNNKDCGKYKRC